MKDVILLVDDNYEIRLLVSKLLTSYSVIAAESGKEMWQILEQTTPSIIILDVMIPGDNGFQLARQLSEQEEYRDIPIIFLTARVSGRDVQEGFRSGGYDYVKKPFDKEELEARIASVLDRKQDERKLKSESATDFLTQIYNRRYFIDAAQKIIDYCKRNDKNLAVSMIDIDSFKKINDQFGHLAGDYILREFAQTLRLNVRPYDLVARYGGEEFVIMFLDCAKEESNQILQRIKKYVEDNKYTFEGQTISLHFSAGISDLLDIGPNPFILDELIKKADQRMYLAKNQDGIAIVC